MKNLLKHNRILGLSLLEISIIILVCLTGATILGARALSSPHQRVVTTKPASNTDSSTAGQTSPQSGTSSSVSTGTQGKSSSGSKTSSPSYSSSPVPTYTPPACDQGKKQYYESQYSSAYAQETSRHQLAVQTIQNKYAAQGAFNSSYEASAEAAENQTYQNNVAVLQSTLKYQLDSIYCD